MEASRAYQPIDNVHFLNERRKSPNNSNILEGSLWMVGITLALFFFPLVNGLIGGFVGGYKVGDVKRAIMAAILPACFAAIGLWVLLALLGLPVVGFLASGALATLIIFSDLGLLAGAALGGWIARSRN